MRKILAVAMAAALAGCLSVDEPEVNRWLVDFGEVPAELAKGGGASFGIVRVAPVQVRSPYDGDELTVLRKDGTVAFDPFNEFAASPSRLLKGAVQDALIASGRFADAVSSGSVVATDCTAEVTVTRLCLDCRGEGPRQARCDLCVRIVLNDDSVRSGSGGGAADASDGNYGAAFSKAVSGALAKALSSLK